MYLFGLPPYTDYTYLPIIDIIMEVWFVAVTTFSGNHLYGYHVTIIFSSRKI